MAGHGSSHDAHDDDHAAHEEKEEELLPDEPPTPLWLPVVGIALALLGLFLFLATRPGAKTVEEMQQGAEEAAAQAKDSRGAVE